MLLFLILEILLILTRYFLFLYALSLSCKYISSANYFHGYSRMLRESIEVVEGPVLSL